MTESGVPRRTKTAVVRRPSSARPKPLAGWREWVVLPDLSPTPIKAKLDTGARTSTLHAFDLSLFEDLGTQWAEFGVLPIQRSRLHRVTVRCPVTSFKKVRSSTGHLERRPVIRTPLAIGSRHYTIEVTLTSRDEMGFRMLLGRSAIRGRFWVDAGRSFLHETPTSTPDRPEGP